jgi:hypothetical protein
MSNSNIETGDLDVKSSDIQDNSSAQKQIETTIIEIKKMRLVIIDTVHMVLGAEYEIFPHGLKTSKRIIKDGCVYAGSLEKQGRIIINDIILPENEKGIGRRHFMIKYNKGKSIIRKHKFLYKGYG